MLLTQTFCFIIPGNTVTNEPILIVSTNSIEQIDIVLQNFCEWLWICVVEPVNKPTRHLVGLLTG